MADSRRELIEKIDDSRRAGASDEQIEQALVNSGEIASDVQLAIKDPASLLYRRVSFRQLSAGRKLLMIILVILFTVLVVANVWYYIQGDFPLGITEYTTLIQRSFGAFN